MTRTKPTIIVADDDLAIRVVVGEALRQEGWMVIEADDLPELHRLVERGQGDVVISDVMMPSGSGLDALPGLLEKRPDLPFVIMSAQNTLSTAMAATNNGAFDYLPKPFDIDELISIVKKALKEKSTLVGGDYERDENILIGARQRCRRFTARWLGW